MDRVVDAAVLGAGIAGSSLAKALADKGWETVLIDRQSFPRHKVCGEFLSPETRSTLNTLGLLEQVESLHPSWINRVRLIFSHGGCIEIPLQGNALGLSRYLLDSAFHGSAVKAGVDLHTETSVRSVYPNNTGYTIATMHKGEMKSFHARAVIAAWGANRRPDLPGRNPRPVNSVKDSFIGVKSHFRGVGFEPVIELYFFPGGYLGLSPIEGGFVNAAAMLERKAFADSEKTVLGIMETAARRNSKLFQKLGQAHPVPGTQAAVAPIVLNLKPLPWDLIPLTGDASLMIPPLCGDGMSMALRSSELTASLADAYLSGGISLHAWEQEYSQSVLQEFKGPLQWGRLFQKLFGLPFVPRFLPRLAQLAPGLAFRLFQATRLKDFDRQPKAGV